MIVDAGGGTVDVSAYRKQPDGGKDRFEEIAVPQCAYLGSLDLRKMMNAFSFFQGHFFGSVFVTIHAKVFMSGARNF